MTAVGRALASAAVALVALACGESSSGDPGVACPTIASASVQVTVVDAQGAAVVDAKVTYAVDGGAEQQADCVLPAGSAGCSQWVAGWERTGSFVVRATSADGAKKTEGSVVVVKSTGDCPHPVQQTLKLTL